jgi:hypothetical protein
MDFNKAIRGLIEEIVQKVDELGHIRPEKVLISATFNRSPRKAGLLAYVLPLKYRAGSPVERRVRGPKEYHWAMLPVQREGVEMLYIVYFMLPRFLLLPPRDRIETVIHELYHISPQFNGDLRRFKGRSVLHGSHKAYDAKIRSLTDSFLFALEPSRAHYFMSPLFLGENPAAIHIPEPRPKLLKVAFLPKS